MTTPHGPYRPQHGDPLLSYGPPEQWQPPAGMPPNMPPPHHRTHPPRAGYGYPQGEWPTPTGQPYPPTAQFAHPPIYPAPAAQPETKRPRNLEAINAVICAAVGILVFSVPMIRAVLGVAAVVLGVIADVKARKHGAPLGRLGLLGALVGVLELLSLFAN